MAPSNPTDDATEKITEYSRETYDDYLAEYEDIHGNPVHEDDDKLVFADAKGHELNEWARDLGLSRETVAAWMHDHADDADYNWSASDPVVLLKQ